MHFNVEFVTASGQKSSSWESITRLYRSKPNIVTAYCSLKGLDISEFLEKEAERQKPFYMRKFSQNGRDSSKDRKSPNISFDG